MAFRRIYHYVSLFFSACKKNNNNPIKKAIDADIYVAGTDKGNAAYWKNGIETKLTNNCTECYANGIALGTNGDVYVAGVKAYNGRDYMAVYWANGTPTYLTDSTKGVESEAYGLYLSGNDVYVGGDIAFNAPSGATWWKNGLIYQVNDPASAVSSIFVSGSDVYVAGETYLSVGSDAAYWKNGTVVKLTNADNADNNGGVVNSIFVSGNDVYTAGNTWDGLSDNSCYATYWKNNIETKLNTSATYAMASSIYIDNGDIYVCGTESKNGVYVAEYWKNGKMITLATTKSDATGIFVLNGHVYVSGSITDETGAPIATVWVDGSAIKVGGSTSFANCLFVKQKSRRILKESIIGQLNPTTTMILGGH